MGSRVSRVNVSIEDNVPAASIVALPRGGIVNGTQAAVNTVNLFRGHEFIVGDKFIYGIDRVTIRADRVFVVTAITSTSVTFSGAVFSFPNLSILVNLGPDTGGAAQADGSFLRPNWNGSRVVAYSDPDAQTAITSAIVTLDAGGEAGFWTTTTTPIWVVGRDGQTLPVRLYIDLNDLSTASATYNVKDFGAKGDGVTDDTAAFTRVRDLIEASVITNPAFDANSNKVGRVVGEVPPGAYKITSAEALMRSTFTTKTVGITWRGTAGPKLCQILYQPSVSGALAKNNDAWQSACFEDLEFNCNDANSDFLDSISSGGPQDYRFVRCIWSGDWRYCFYLSSGTNSNSEWYIENCRWGGDYDTVLYIPSGLSDQELNFWFITPVAWLNTGRFISAAKGGHFKIYGGDFEMLTTYTVDTYFIELLGSSHAAAVTSLEMDGTRFELRDDNSKFLYCEWTHGLVRLCSLDMSSAYATRTDTVVAVVFVGASAALPEIAWEQCKLIGRHEYQYAANGYLYKRHVRYEDCEFWQHADPDEFIVFTALAGTTNLGSRPQIEFRRCSFKEAASQTDFRAAELADTTYNFFGTSVGLTTECVLSLKTAIGAFPINATVTGYVPLNCYITKVRLWSPLGATAEADPVTYTVQTGESTPTVLATLTAGRGADGFDVTVECFFECDSDTKRTINLVGGANVSIADTQAVCLISYVG